jgi:hypothetical protein
MRALAPATWHLKPALGHDPDHSGARDYKGRLSSELSENPIPAVDRVRLLANVRSVSLKDKPRSPLDVQQRVCDD